MQYYSLACNNIDARLTQGSRYRNAVNILLKSACINDRYLNGYNQNILLDSGHTNFIPSRYCLLPFIYESWKPPDKVLCFCILMDCFSILSFAHVHIYQFLSFFLFVLVSLNLTIISHTSDTALVYSCVVMFLLWIPSFCSIYSGAGIFSLELMYAKRNAHTIPLR